MASRTIKLKLLDGYKNGVPDEKDVELPFEDFNGNSQGKPITKKYAKELVNRKWTGLGNSETAAVVFDIRPIVTLLSQKDCTGIRFYYADLESGEDTLVLVGVDANGHDIGIGDPENGKKGSIILDPTPDEKSIIIEVGGGNKKTDFA